jgi:hypothetical protein
VRIRDLGSRNGTRVNGEKLEGEQPLFAGDTVTIGVDGADPLPVAPIRPAPPAGATARTLRRRLAEELERARQFDRPCGVSACSSRAPDPDPIAVRLERELRRVDFARWLSPAELVGVMPEMPQTRRRRVLRRVLRLGAGVAPRRGPGWRSTRPPPASRTPCWRRRVGARAGAPRRAGGGPDRDVRVEIGDRSMVVADPAMRGCRAHPPLARTDLRC